jgi:hypothetical protein
VPPHCMAPPTECRRPSGGLSRADALMWGPLLGP